MNTIGIQTTQNVALNYRLAGVGTRIVAYLLDSLFLFALYILTLLFVFQTNLGPFVIFVMLGIGWLYFLLFEIFTDGQTAGKRIMKIKVVRTDGSKPSIGNYLLRWIMIPLEFGIGSGAIALISIIITQKGQRLGDLLAGTTVVRITQSNINQLQKRKALISIEDDYTPIYPEAAEMSDEEILLIGKALKAFQRNGARKPMENLAARLREKYGITKEDLPIRFLNTLQKDHAFHNKELDAAVEED